jgi:hypothetical protein
LIESTLCPKHVEVLIRVNKATVNIQSYFYGCCPPNLMIVRQTRMPG